MTTHDTIARHAVTLEDGGVGAPEIEVTEAMTAAGQDVLGDYLRYNAQGWPDCSSARRRWRSRRRPGSQSPRESQMRYKAKSVAALQTLLGSWPDRMRVEVDPNIGVSARTVGELRKVTTWPENLAIATPPAPDPESAIKVSKASTATRVSPKP